MDDILEQCEQRFLAALVPALHETPVALAGRGLAPAEVVHLVAILLHLLRPLLLFFLQHLVPQLSPHLPREALGGVVQARGGGGEHLDGTAFAAHWLAPAEVLHGVGALSGSHASPGKQQGGGEREGRGGVGVRGGEGLEVGVTWIDWRLSCEVRPTELDTLL